MDQLRLGIVKEMRAPAHPQRRAPEVRVEDAGGSYPVLEMTETGFLVAVEDAPHLRGFVDLVCDGERLARCLIFRVSDEGGVVRYEYKRRTEEVAAPPRDYAVAGPSPAGLLSAETVTFT